MKSSSPLEYPPPIPQRSHARVASTASSASLTPPTPKRPGVAPLRTNGNDILRSRSETVASASLRQRRQGYVPKRGERKVTGELNPLTEAPSEPGDRLSQASTIKPTHNRATSSISTVNSFLNSSGGETSSSGGSPSETATSIETLPRTRARLPTAIPADSMDNFSKAARRLASTLIQLQRPVESVWGYLEAAPGADTNLRSIYAAANSSVFRMEDMLRAMSNGSNRSSPKAVLQRANETLQAYGAIITTIKQNIAHVVRLPDGMHVRTLMLFIYATTVEARNICALLGHAIKEKSSQRDTLRASRAWSSRTATPTQPKTPSDRRTRRPTVMRNASTATTIRPMAPPPIPVNTAISRQNTAIPLGSATPRSAEPFLPLSDRPQMSRANTMRSMMGSDDPDDNFEEIFLKLRTACDQASHALIACRTEFMSRKEHARSMSQPRPAHHWTTALEKCEVVSTHNEMLKKRLEMVKVNDPSVRYQRDFWQLCDAFVHVSPPFLHTEQLTDTAGNYSRGSTWRQRSRISAAAEWTSPPSN